MRYDVATPKHLRAMARSKANAPPGSAALANRLNVDGRPTASAASERRRSPKAPDAANPTRKILPATYPQRAMAAGKPSIPAPSSVFASTSTPDSTPAPPPAREEGLLAERGRERADADIARAPPAERTWLSLPEDREYFNLLTISRPQVGVFIY
eukprot:scaffold109257_cov34-Tisochrysis_lutea.AAC.1